MDAILLAANVLSVPEPNTAPLAASCHQHLVKIATNIEYRIGWEQSCTVILSQSSDWRRCSTSLSQPPSSKIKVMYPEDASVRSVKISPVHKIVLQGLCQNLQPYKVLVNK
jgi:hypothetical protein